ncbi:MAG: hypothetical protein A2Y34_01200 [Spirochaetes bacterium GWC1_27_15]|nr:MAG: hypothetical protein A2Z98_18420 [Spirochaetes bacterium GWB1_27_13]OHD21454.1 MAG: hypothetical protein A2Y34_01200 [Spirochaetes bacterium GWC1_27_15]
MKKKILVFVFINIYFSLFCGIILPDYNKTLPLPFIQPKNETKDQKLIFSFKIGDVPGDLSIFGNWKIRVGFGTGFVLFPELAFLLNVPNMKQGLIFEQQRVFTVDWITDNGINLHLFFNDDLNATEFSFKYQVQKVLNSIYITNKFNGFSVNHFRELKGGRPQDINFGLDWQHKFYKGRFDIQFDSVKKVTDSFRGNKKFVDAKIFSSQYERGIYYYLPDKNIGKTIEVFISDDKGENFTDLPQNFSEPKKYTKLVENLDYKLDVENGLITFKQSSYKKTLLIYYEANINGSFFEVGNNNCGKNGIFGGIDFNKSSFSQYFVKHNNKDYLILSFQNNYSYFEEKNSYKVTSINSQISSLSVDIFDENNLRLTGFYTIYDEYTGCIRIRKSDIKADQYNIYPFIDSVDKENFYLSFNTPKESGSKNMINYSFFLTKESLKLTNNPVEQSILVYLNSILLDKSKYSYDFVTQSIVINLDLNDNDIVEVSYTTEDVDSYNLTAALQNEFKLNDYLILGDSFWYKMPVKLWEDSFYNKLHSIEFLYNLNLSGNFKKFLIDKKNGKLDFTLSAVLSVFNPEIKSLTIVEDFEYELKGYPLDLEYKRWFPVSIPTIYKELNGVTYGKLYYRNLHKYGITANASYMSLYDSIPDRDGWVADSQIGPYSSNDGYNGEKNSLSLVTEFDLQAGEAISIATPLTDSNFDFTKFPELTAAIKVLELTGNVDIYLDCGLISEKFNALDNLTQKETMDEGLKYLVNNFYLYKGKNDGQNSTNDFNGNGLLDIDTTSDISKLKYFTNFDNSADYFTVGTGDKKVVNFKIDYPERLKNPRGLRLTIYSKNGASGKLFFNQLRFTETGWEYGSVLFGKKIDSYAQEIFPAEDSLLEANIFSQKNKDFDSKLHFQRFRERTLRVKLKKDEQIFIKKRFLTPIDISYFKKLGFFLFLQNHSSKMLNIYLKDTQGNEIVYKTSLFDKKDGLWHKIMCDFNQFQNYDSSSKQITEVKFEFLNNDSVDNTIFIDEIFMDEPNTFFGFGTRNEFNYYDSGLNLKTKGGFSIFSNPLIKLMTSFNTENFLRNELKPDKNYILTNEFTMSFKFVTLDFFVNSNLDFVFKNYSVYNPKEDFRLKVIRNPSQKLPLFFTFFYDYKKTGIPDAAGNLSLSAKNENRKLLLDIGFQIPFVFLKTGYNIDTLKKEVFYNSNKFDVNFRVNVSDISFKIVYSIDNKRKQSNLSGVFSLDNLGYVFYEDFTSFFYEGEQKSQLLNLKTDFNFFTNFSFTNEIEYKDAGSFLGTKNSFVFNNKYSNKSIFDIKTSFNSQTKSFFIAEYKRSIDNSYQKDYQNIYWDVYFYNFGNSFNYITPLFFFPPFSSIYTQNKKRLFGENIRFASFGDTLKFTLDWSIYLQKIMFLPYKFVFTIVESITNLVNYNSVYDISFSLFGTGELKSGDFNNISLEYSITQNINIKPTQTDFKTENNLTLNFYLLNGMSIENIFSYNILYTDSTPKKEFNHSFSFASKLYKDFFKKNYELDDVEGVELTFLLEATSNFYQRLDRITDNLDNPLKVYFTPTVGYRFNKNITVSGKTRFGYTMDSNQMTKYIKHNFGLEITVEGIISF